jgi:hypothetical protein
MSEPALGRWAHRGRSSRRRRVAEETLLRHDTARHNWMQTERKNSYHANTAVKEQEARTDKTHTRSPSPRNMIIPPPAPTAPTTSFRWPSGYGVRGDEGRLCVRGLRGRCAAGLRTRYTVDVDEGGGCSIELPIHMTKNLEYSGPPHLLAQSPATLRPTPPSSQVRK